MGEREANLVRTTLRALNALPQTRAVKIHGSPFARVGAPDILGCSRGRFFALEAKSKGKRPRKIQAIELERWGRAGATVGWFDHLDAALEIVRGIQD